MSYRIWDEEPTRRISALEYIQSLRTYMSPAYKMPIL